MDDSQWTTALNDLDKAAEMATVLGRCLAIRPELDAWRVTRAELHGIGAANALDQARGDLERLSSGGLHALVHLVESILAELPTPWE